MRVQCSLCGEIFRVPRLLAEEFVAPPPICPPPASPSRRANLRPFRPTANLLWSVGLGVAGVIVAMILWSHLSSDRWFSPVDPSGTGKSVVRPATGKPKTTDPRPDNAAKVQQATTHARESPWTKVVERCKPSVVLLRSLTVNDEVGTGSGFFVNDGQTLVTNYHVVKSAKSILASLPDGTSVSVAGYLAISPEQDLAVLRLERAVDGIVPLTVAASLPRPGDRVLALGAPHGLIGSVSDGIVSGVRTGQELDAAIHGHYSLETLYALDTEWVQTSAPISPGNSGGPLLNSLGQVVGVNAFSLAVDSQNLNFAVSVRHVQRILAGLPSAVRALATLPTPAKTRAELAAERENESQLESERVLLAKADAERKRVLAAIESTKLSGERQDELRRLSDLIVQVRSELSRIEANGIGLQARHNEAIAQGKAVFLVGSQIARRSVVALTQLSDLQGCVRRRQAVVNGLLAVLDNHPAPYDAVGLAQVRSEYSLKALEVANLRSEATIAEASFVKLDQEARSLLGQLKYLADQRESTRKELQGILDRQAALEAAKP